jgi:hypothetical protein
MALWGNLDSKSSVGTVSLNYDTLTVTGSGTSFGAEGSAVVGDIIRFGQIGGEYYGDAVIVGITSATQLKISSTSNLSGAVITAVPYSISQLPKFTTLDSHYKAEANPTYTTLVYGADVDEVEVSAKTSYDLTHAGWVGITTYLDWDGNLRVKSEVLVSMSSIEGDAEDDAVLPDVSIIFLSNPQSVSGLGSTSTVTLQSLVGVTPSGSPLSYRWQFSPDNTTYSNVINSSIYSGATTTTLTIANTDTSLDGFFYRLSVTSGDTIAFSGIASITFAS